MSSLFLSVSLAMSKAMMNSVFDLKKRQRSREASFLRTIHRRSVAEVCPVRSGTTNNVSSDPATKFRSPPSPSFLTLQNEYELPTWPMLGREILVQTNIVCTVRCQLFPSSRRCQKQGGQKVKLHPRQSIILHHESVSWSQFVYCLWNRTGIPVYVLSICSWPLCGSLP